MNKIIGRGLSLIPKMEVFRKLNGVKSRLLVWGDPFSSEMSDVIVHVTGNPGIVDFYDEFGTELYKTTKMPICVVGQSGHDVIPDEKAYDLKSHGYLLDLKGQIAHKLDLINNFSKNSKLHLIGHSIGAWMLIETISKDPSIADRVASINLLFPTLQKLALTKNANYVNNIIRNYHSPVMFFIMLLNMLPESILRIMIKIYLKCRSLPYDFTNGILKYVKHAVIERVLYLAYDEMDNVTSLNTEVINKVKHKTTVIYGEEDGWVPLEFIEDLRQFQPFLQMIKVPYTHDFTMRSAKDVAQLVSNCIIKSVVVNE